MLHPGWEGVQGHLEGTPCAWDSLELGEGAASFRERQALCLRVQGAAQRMGSGRHRGAPWPRRDGSDSRRSAQAVLRAVVSGPGNSSLTSPPPQPSLQREPPFLALPNSRTFRAWEPGSSSSVRDKAVTKVAGPADPWMGSGLCRLAGPVAMVTAHPPLCSEAGIVWAPECGKCPGAWAGTMALVCLCRDPGAELFPMLQPLSSPAK